jgi:hypothetical protein
MLLVVSVRGDWCDSELERRLWLGAKVGAIGPLYALKVALPRTRSVRQHVDMTGNKNVKVMLDIVDAIVETSFTILRTAGVSISNYHQ